MNIYEINGKKYEVLCECNTNFSSLEYEKFYGYGYYTNKIIRFINEGKYDTKCTICNKFYYYDNTEPLCLYDEEFITEEEFSM